MSEEQSGISEESTYSTSDSRPHRIGRHIRGVSDVADKRASTFLLSVGTALLILAVIVRIRLFGVSDGEMLPVEFISLLVVCLGCLLAGAYVRMMQERLSNEHELKLLEASIRFSLKSQETPSKGILEAQKNADQAIERPNQSPRLPGG